MPVVDASVVVDWVAPNATPDHPSVRLQSALIASGAAIHAPGLLILETANVLASGIRRRRWSGADADRAHDLLTKLPIKLVDDGRDVTRAWELSRRYDEHPVYDMVYVALAERLGMRLVTADAALRKRLAGVDRLVAPEDL